MDISVVYAKAPIRVVINGAVMRFPPGSHWPADDPFVLDHPDEFSTDPRYHMAFTEVRPGYLGDEPVVEQASAAPGERRRTGRS